MSSLLGKCAIVTGGSRGIGFTIAQKLISEGAKVVICSRNKSELEKAVKLLNHKAASVFGKLCDVSKANECRNLIMFAKSKLKKIDILVNNAGVYGPIGPLEKIDVNEWKKAMEINLLGVIYCSHFVIPNMKKNKGGKIINLCGAGIGSSKTMPNFTSYYTSKGAIAAFTEVLAEELKNKNIQVNCISPGAVNTYLNEYLIKQGREKSGDEVYNQALRQKKEGGTSPNLAAELVAFLASDKADNISGRLLSAKWNPPLVLKKVKNLSSNLFKLRRIDEGLFYEKKE